MVLDPPRHAEIDIRAVCTARGHQIDTLRASQNAEQIVRLLVAGIDGGLVYTGAPPPTASQDAGVLVLWLAVAFGAAAVGATRMTRFRTLRDLRPSLIG